MFSIFTPNYLNYSRSYFFNWIGSTGPARKGLFIFKNPPIVNLMIRPSFSSPCCLPGRHQAACLASEAAEAKERKAHFAAVGVPRTGVNGWSSKSKR